MQFYEVDEDVIYEEEEEEEEDKNVSNKKLSNKKNSSYYYKSVTASKTIRSSATDSTGLKSSLRNSNLTTHTPNKLKLKNNKLKITNTGTIPYTSDKLEKSPKDKLLKLANSIPAIMKQIKGNKKLKKKDTKKLLIEGNLKKLSSKNINSTVLTLKSLEERILYTERPIYKYRSKVKPIKKDEPHQKKTVAVRVRSRTIKQKPNVCVYPFILRKKPEYGDSTMYLTGSLPQLGNFNPKLAIPMDEENRNNQIFNTKYIDIRREEFPFEYKYFYIKDEDIIWVGMPFSNYKTH